MTGPAAHRGRRDNGLDCDAYSAVADVDPRLADHLLDVLLLRQVPAYVEPAPVGSARSVDRLYVAADHTTTARELLDQFSDELGIENQAVSSAAEPDVEDLLRGRDTDAEFQAIIASFDDDLRRPLFDPTTSPATHAVTSQTDDTVEHFVPPPPPPLRLPGPAVGMAALLAVMGVLVMAFGWAIGLGNDISFPLGVILVLFGGGLLVMQLRDDDDEDGDDGAVV